MAQFADQILNLVEQKLADQSNHDHGTLAKSTVEEVMIGLRGHQDPDLLRLLHEGWGKMCLAVEEAQWRDARRFPLERLIIHHFEPLMAPRGEDAIQGQTLSRRVIPAFLAALSQMIGKELLNEYEERCREMVDLIHQKHGDAFEWQMVYEDINANILAQDIIVYIAQYFRDVPKRRLWMIDIFARSMPPAGTPGEQEWDFDAAGFHLLVNGLYADLFAMMKDADSIGQLRARYGDDRLDALVEVEKGLEQDRGALLGG